MTKFGCVAKRLTWNKVNLGMGNGPPQKDFRVRRRNYLSPPPSAERPTPVAPLAARAASRMIPAAMMPHLSISRRSLLAGATATLIASRAQAEGRPVLRVGTLPFGSVNWGIATILDNGFDKAAGLTVENVPLANNEAARIGFLSGSVDVIVTDLLFAARLRAEGKDITFLPYSSSEGSLVVKAGSPIKAIADLKGKSIGVAGGALDKSWLLLQAAAKKAGVDLAREARPVFGAPPLLSLKLESGELDAGLLYWTYAARLPAKDYRTVASVEDIAESLGAKGKIAFTGFVFKDTTTESTKVAFGMAERQAETLMAADPVWTKLRPLMKAPDEATFTALKDAFQRGIPHKPRDAEIADAIGGTALVGQATTLPEGLYVDQKVYG